MEVYFNLNIDFSNITLKKCYEYEDVDYKLIVFGNHFGEIPKSIRMDSLDLKNIQKLNFDGDYVAFFFNHRKNLKIVFRSHIDNFSLFYVQKGDTIYFSNDFYSLLPYIEKATWNLDAIADYFEINWNLIAKYDRSPLIEIKRLDTCRYMLFVADESPVINSWKNFKREYRYNIENLEEFKEAFFEVLDYYLRIIHDRYGDAAFSVSGGIDANTLSAEYVRIYPNNKSIFFTSKFDDVDDESKLAAHMQKCLNSKLKYIPINLIGIDIITYLQKYISNYMIPRFFNELSEDNFIQRLSTLIPKKIFISGMGADLTFGGFACEYFPLINELLDKNEIQKALDIFVAAKVSFENNSDNILQNFYNYCLNYSSYKMNKNFIKKLGLASNPGTGGVVVVESF